VHVEPPSAAKVWSGNVSKFVAGALRACTRLHGRFGERRHTSMSVTGVESRWDRLSLHDLYTEGRKLRLHDRLDYAGRELTRMMAEGHGLGLAQVLSVADREVEVADPVTGEPVTMVMFGSNNYLGLAGHPEVRERARRAVVELGVGATGPPIFNGYSHLHQELEARLAAFKGTEAAMLFASGYAANLGVFGGLVRERDLPVFDEYVHASYWDGIRLAACARFRRFRHNDADHLDRVLSTVERPDRDVYVGIEGVYSMDGDLAPLDRIVPMARRHGAIVVLDDAHATGVLGENGRGSAEHFGVEGQVDVITATLGKSFGVLGGVVCASADLIGYLRFVARSHLFSTAPPPALVASALAALDVLEREPERRAALLDNVAYAAKALAPFGVQGNASTAILALPIPDDLDPAQVVECLQRHRVFLNYAPFPAVPRGKQRFRISVMATHTKADIDRLVECIADVWATRSPDESEESEEGAA
jgi:glycine C-acetyltransferase